MDSKLIRRMISLGYTNEDIIGRIRCTNQAIDSIRELIRLEEEKANKPAGDYDWDE